MKYPIKSILETISTKVFIMNDVDSAKKYCINEIEKHNIDSIEKTKMLNEIKSFTKLNKLSHYLCNALLKFEGLGMNNFKRTCKEQAIENQN